MRVEALRRLRLHGKTIEAGDAFDLPGSFEWWLDRGWVKPEKKRTKAAPENRVIEPAENREQETEPKPKAKPKKKAKPKGKAKEA